MSAELKRAARESVEALCQRLDQKEKELANANATIAGLKHEVESSNSVRDELTAVIAALDEARQEVQDLKVALSQPKMHNSPIFVIRNEQEVRLRPGDAVYAGEDVRFDMREQTKVGVDVNGRGFLGGDEDGKFRADKLTGAYGFGLQTIHLKYAEPFECKLMFTPPLPWGEATIYFEPNRGNDANPGTLDKPMRNKDAAVDRMIETGAAVVASLGESRKEAAERLKG